MKENNFFNTNWITKNNGTSADNIKVKNNIVNYNVSTKNSSINE